jgi:hypothetical protein
MALDRSGWGFLGTVVLGLVMIAGLIVAGTLLLAGVSLVAADALSYRRWPWISVPAAAAGGAFLLRVIVHSARARRRMIATIKGRVLDCPSCGAPLPRWDGSFAWFPPEPEDIDWIGRPPEGRFRLSCDRCLRDAWFYAHIDGSVNHADRGPDRPDGIVVNLDDFEA